MQHCMWTPGENLAVITRNGVIVIEKGYSELTQEFWTLLEDGVDLGTLLQALTSACGTNLAALPNFVALVPEAGGVHVAVRGAFELTLETSSETITMTGGNVITWEEKRIDGLTGWKITSPIQENAISIFTQADELIAASAVIPISTVSFGALSAKKAETRENQTNKQNKHSQSHTESDKIKTQPASLLSPTTEITTTPSIDSPPEKTLIEFPEIHISKDEKTNAQQPPEYTLTEEQAHLTRAYTDDDDLHTSSLTGETEDKTATDAGTNELAVTTLETLAVPNPGSDFSDLFSEHTRAISIEDAAVRNVRNDDNPFADIPSTHNTTANPLERKQGERENEQGTDAALENSAEKSMAAYLPPTVIEQAVSASEPPKAPQGFFIDSVPSISSTTASRPATPEIPTENNQQSNTPTQGIHDGHTIRSDKMAYIRQQTQSLSVETISTPTANDAPLVVALLCVAGHPNPTHVQVCRVCEGPMTEQSTTVARPTLGTLYFSTGEVVALDRDVIIGRRPRYTPQPGRPEAHIVPVPSPNQEISRTHCEIRIDGWEVRVRDLGSNNGTFLLRQGQSPVRVTDATPVLLRAGDILDLGDAVSVRMEA